MSYFQRIDGHLHAEQVPMQSIAERFGTPSYVYSRAAFEAHFLAYQQALSGCSHLICYAVKANSNIAVLNILARLGSGFDIVSVGELERVLLAGGDPGKVVFSGVAKTEKEIERALEVGVHCFNVESESELQRINRVALRLQTTAPISLRVNPDVDANTHPYISTGLQENKFGIPIERAVSVYEAAKALPGLRIIGVDCHIGSQLTTLSPFADALDRVLNLVDTLSDKGIVLEHIDIGGGLGVRYCDETPPSANEYIQVLRDKMGDREATLVIEPGRSIAANAGILLTQVEFLKSNGDRNFAIVDAAMNDMIRPALYDAWLNIHNVSEHRNATSKVYDIVGPVCETGDFLGKSRELAIAEGDLLCVDSAGAYGFTMSSNYNSRPRAAEVMVDGDRVHLIRARESIDDLVRGEQCLPDAI